MMIDKRVQRLRDAVVDINDGATIMVGGFASQGHPAELLDALYECRPNNLTVVCITPSMGFPDGVSAFIASGSIEKLICAHPRAVGFPERKRMYKESGVSIEVIPLGTLVERIRCAGAGLGGFYTPTGADTDLAKGKEVRVINGVPHFFEEPLHADFALLKAEQADRWGNLTYCGANRNITPIMATAASITIVQVEMIVELGHIHPEHVITPGIFIDRVVELSQ